MMVISPGLSMGLNLFCGLGLAGISFFEFGYVCLCQKGFIIALSVLVLLFFVFFLGLD